MAAHVPAQSGTARNTVGGNAAVPCGSMTAGFLCVVCAFDDSSTTLPTIPAGFGASLGSVANTSGALICARMVTAGDTTYNFNAGGINNIAVIYDVFSAALMITSAEVTSTTQVSSGTPATFAANTLAAGSLSLLYAKAGGSIAMSTWASGWNEIHDMASPSLAAALNTAPGSGAVTPGNAAWASSASARGSFHVEIPSAGGALVFQRPQVRNSIYRR